MTAKIVAQRVTERTCEEHPDVNLVEVLFRSDQLKNDWLLSICPTCQAEAALRGEHEQDPSRRFPEDLPR